MSRPKKYLKSRMISLCCDEKDLAFLDNHKGKMTRGDYLIESMYAIKLESSNRFKEIFEKSKSLVEENNKLKKELFFKNNKTETNKVDNYNELLNWYISKNIKYKILKYGLSNINFKNLYDKNIVFFADKLKSYKELETFCIEEFRKANR